MLSFVHRMTAQYRAQRLKRALLVYMKNYTVFPLLSQQDRKLLTSFSVEELLTAIVDSGLIERTQLTLLLTTLPSYSETTPPSPTSSKTSNVRSIQSPNPPCQ